MAINFSSTYYNKLTKEKEDWLPTFLYKINPNNISNAVSNRCPTWRRIFDWIKQYGNGIKTNGLVFASNNLNDVAGLDIALSRMHFKTLSVKTVRNSYSESFNYNSQTGDIQEVFRFTTDSSSAREYIFGNFTVILSGSGFSNSGGGAYSWGVRFYLYDSNGVSLSNFGYIDKRVGNSGDSYTYSTSATITTNWNTINHDFSPNTTYIVKAQLYTGNPFDGTATLQWTISNAAPTIRCFIMDRCPKNTDAYGVVMEADK